jgi:hypothetical protein
VNGHHHTSTSINQQAKHQTLLLLLFEAIQPTTTTTTDSIKFKVNLKPQTTMPSNIFNTMAARAKAHHESVNAAYLATYAPGSSSTTNTPTTSRKSSTTSQDSQSERNITKAWKAVKKHHQEMNQAYSVFYSTPGSSRSSSVAPTPKTSFEAQRVQREQESQTPRNYEKLWMAIKNKAVEHHRSVNAASRIMHSV